MTQTQQFYSQRPLRIAILECDTPAERTRARYGGGGYGAVFKALLDAGASEVSKVSGPDELMLQLTYWDVVSEKRYPQIEDVDGVLLTGSRMCFFFFFFFFSIPKIIILCCTFCHFCMTVDMIMDATIYGTIG